MQKTNLSAKNSIYEKLKEIGVSQIEVLSFNPQNGANAIQNFLNIFCLPNA